MNVLMVNPVHPSSPHVSAVRAWRFAQELAHRGHRVVLLAARRGDAEVHEEPAFESHDWREPLVLSYAAVHPTKAANLRPSLLRKVVTAARMVRDGGRHGAWARDSVVGIAQFAGAFKPDVVWCTFGTLEAALVAKWVAKANGCPWVLDIKDNWELYVPRGLRRLMAWRIKGWTALTANAGLTATVARKWHRVAPTVIYSGVEFEFFPEHGVDEVDRDEFVVNLIGGIYFPDRLAQFFGGLQAWLESLRETERARVVIRYFGGDGPQVEAVALHHLPGFRVEQFGFVPVKRLAENCRVAAVNAYIAYPALFHHKLLELLACARPVLAFGSECQESVELATEFAGKLMVAKSAIAVQRTLDSIHSDWMARMPPPNVRWKMRFTWPSQAIVLERILAAVTRE